MIAAPLVTKSPVTRVLAAFDGGAMARRSIAESAQLSEDLASAIIDQLVRTGQLTRESLFFGCPPKGCGDCGAAGPTSDRCVSGGRDRPQPNRPTLVVLSRAKLNGS